MQSCPGRRPAHLAADEAIAYDFIIELYDRNEVSDATYAKFVGAFGERGVVELVGLLGYYNTIATDDERESHPPQTRAPPRRCRRWRVRCPERAPL